MNNRSPLTYSVNHCLFALNLVMRRYKKLTCILLIKWINDFFLLFFFFAP